MRPFSSSAFLCKKTFHEKNPYTNVHLPSFSHDTGHKLLQVKKGGTMLHHLSGIHTWPVPAQTVDFLSNGKLVRGFLLLWKEMGKQVYLSSKEKASIFVQDIFEPENGFIYLENERDSSSREWDIAPISVRILHKAQIKLTSGRKFLRLQLWTRTHGQKQKLQPDSFFNHLEIHHQYPVRSQYPNLLV